MVSYLLVFCAVCFVIGAVLGRWRKKRTFGGTVGIIAVSGVALVGVATFGDLPDEQAALCLIVGWMLCGAVAVASMGYTLFQPIDKYGY